MTFADHLFRCHRFDRLVRVLCVRWYVTYKLSDRDLVERMAERGLSMAHTTIMCWVLKLVPMFEQRSCKYARPVDRSWRVDETYRYCWRIHETGVLASNLATVERRFRAVLDNSPTVSTLGLTHLR